MNRADLLKGSLLMMGVVIIWGSFLPVSKLALRVIDPYWLSSLRWGLAALAFMLALVCIEGRRNLAIDEHGRLLFTCGSLGFCGFSVLAFEGVRLTRPEHGAVILALVPVWITLWIWFKSGLRPASATLACVASALCGEILVVSGGEPTRLLQGGNNLGNLMVLGASLCWTVYTLGVQKLPRWSPLRFTTLSASLGWISIFALSLLATGLGHASPPSPAALLPAAWEIAYIVVVVSFVATFFWNTAVRKLGALNAALFGNFAPVVTYFIAAWQGRKMAALELLGVALVIAALVTNNIVNRRLAARAARLAAGASA